VKSCEPGGAWAILLAAALSLVSAVTPGRVFGLAPPIEEVVEAPVEGKARMSFSIGGNIPLRDLAGPYNTGTVMRLTVGYRKWKILQLEGGIGYTTGFVDEGVVAIGWSGVVEFRVNYLSLPFGVRVPWEFRSRSMELSAGTGFLYNRYTESLNVIDYYGLASRTTAARSGFGYYLDGMFGYYFMDKYGLGLEVRWVKNGTDGENVGGVLGSNDDSEKKGPTSDGWLSITAGLLYRF